MEILLCRSLIAYVLKFCFCSMLWPDHLRNKTIHCYSDFKLHMPIATSVNIVMPTAYIARQVLKFQTLFETLQSISSYRHHKKLVSSTLHGFLVI